MADLEALSSEIRDDPLGRGYSGMTSEQIADDLNTAYVQRLVAIPTSEIKRYLFTRNLWLAIKRGTHDSAEQARDSLSMFEQFHIDKPEVSATVGGLLDALIADGYIEERHKQEVQAMGVEFITRAEEKNLGNPTVHQIDVARG